MLSTSSNAVKGVLAMVASTALITGNDAVAKYLAADYPIGQILFCRQLCGLLLVLAFAGAGGQLHQLRVVDWVGQLVRALLFVITTFLIVLALAILPLPVVSSVLFTRPILNALLSGPILIALLSGPLLGETVGIHRWLAALLGFVGVLVIVRPGAAAFAWIAVLPLAPALISGLRDIITRRLTRTETSMSILFWSNAMILPAGLVTLTLGSQWQPMTSPAAGWLLFNGLLNLSAHFLMIHALRIADASLVAPFKYTGLIWAFLLGFLIWGYTPDMWTVAGSALIVGSGLYALERQPRPPVNVAPRVPAVINIPR